jgi:hypothetical protein
LALPCSGGLLEVTGACPVPGQQLVEFGGGMIVDPGQHIGQPGTRINIVQFAGDNTIPRKA